MPDVPLRYSPTKPYGKGQVDEPERSTWTCGNGWWIWEIRCGVRRLGYQRLKGQERNCVDFVYVHALIFDEDSTVVNNRALVKKQPSPLEDCIYCCGHASQLLQKVPQFEGKQDHPTWEVLILLIIGIIGWISPTICTIRTVLLRDQAPVSSKLVLQSAIWHWPQRPAPLGRQHLPHSMQPMWLQLWGPRFLGEELKKPGFGKTA